MAANYPGNSAAAQAPSSAPGPGVNPIGVLPADTDGATWANLYQAIKVCLDFLAYVFAYVVSANRLWAAPSTGLTPQVQFKDAAGNVRWVIDHNGYPTGSGMSQFREEWFANPGANNSLWSNSGGAGGSILSTNPTANYGARFVILTPATAASGVYAGIGSKLFMSNSTWLTAVVEFELGFNAAAAGITSNTSWYAGLGTQADPSTDTCQIAILKRYNNANFYLLTSSGGGIATLTATSTPPSASGANPIDRVRLEIYGSGSVEGAYKVKLYVNEVLIATVAAANVSAAMLPIFGVYNEGGGPSGSPLGYMGPPRVTWNRYLSGAAL
jgi:hypothetical protein